MAVGLLADRILGEPPGPVHPVARFGGAMRGIEDRCWADDRKRGVVYALAGGSIALVAAGVGDAAVGPSAALGAATALCAAHRSLRTEACAIADLLASGDLPGARLRLPSLVGRDVGHLDAPEIARAAVESVAENLSDAVVATALWGLAGGASGALLHRAVNTLDAMVGHHSPRYEAFGWAAARADDLLGWPAARLTAVLVGLARPGRAGAVWTAVRRDAPHHPSPNAGVAEAAFAAALGLRLGGMNRYAGRPECRPALGEGPAPAVVDVERAVALADDVATILVVACCFGWLCAGRGGERGAPRPRGAR
ncbi:MAG TPA: CobD/CbiB family cobalamin biosynthesis protein [Acidimicrobiales bacterium]